MCVRSCVCVWFSAHACVGQLNAIARSNERNVHALVCVSNSMEVNNASLRSGHRPWHMRAQILPRNSSSIALSIAPAFFSNMSTQNVMSSCDFNKVNSHGMGNKWVTYKLFLELYHNLRAFRPVIGGQSTFVCINMMAKQTNFVCWLFFLWGNHWAITSNRDLWSESESTFDIII